MGHGERLKRQAGVGIQQANPGLDELAQEGVLGFGPGFDLQQCEGDRVVEVGWDVGLEAAVVAGWPSPSWAWRNSCTCSALLKRSGCSTATGSASNQAWPY
ncbi:MAG: hypothetical protein VBE63_27810 [Lamprobacter sp.]|uniref:hypothetical protein n=1 Tax=Lamprobacter sp. TaxID=3100796 RepID=UPI002B2569B2|nr:hypothetical protein [Lamprobacter sp.]MEA3643704.1 hypothetical protein [Lamprobacter sp.]